MRKQRLLAVLMALALMFTLLPTSALADGENVAQIGETTYTSLADAINQASSGDTVKLLENVTLSSKLTVESGKNLILDLNGQTITAAAGNFSNSWVVDVVGGLTITDNSADADGKIDLGTAPYGIFADGSGSNVTLQGGQITGSSNSLGIYSSNGSVVIQGGEISGAFKYAVEAHSGTVSVEGGKITANASSGTGSGIFTDKVSLNVTGGEISGSTRGIYVAAGSTVTISGDAEISGNSYGLQVMGDGTETNVPEVMVNDGTITGGTYGIVGNGSESYANTNITINGGTIKATNTTSSAGIYHPQAGTLTITGGEITGSTGIQMCSGDLVISGSPEITATGNSVDKTENDGLIQDGAAISAVNRSYPGGEPTVTITGTPTVSTASGVDAVQAYTWSDDSSSEWSDAGDKINISGGTFTSGEEKSKLPETYYPDGALLTQEDDGTVVAKTADDDEAVAEVGGVPYGTLQAAINAAGTTAAEVKLLSDTNENVTVAQGQNITLDLNGKTLDGGTTPRQAALTNSGTVTIKDSSSEQTGTIKRSDTSKAGCYYTIENNGTMTIESGNVYNHAGGDSSTPWSGSSLICNGNKSAATLTITGGTISQDYFIAVKNDENGTLSITGGTISSETQAVQNWKTANITGGTIVGSLIKAYTPDGNGNIFAESKDNGGDINVSNGNFSESVDPEYLAEDLTAELYSTAVNEDAPYSYYKNASDAITAADNAGDTEAKITLLNVDEEEGTSQVTVTLNANGGTVSVDTIKVTSGNSTALPTPKRTGYTFQGWYNATSGGTKYTKDTAITGDVTLYARWTANSTSSSSSSGSSGYTVDITKPSNGTLTASDRTPSKGSTVILTVKPNSGYALENLTVTDSQGNAVRLTKKSDTQYTFTMPSGKVTVKAVFAKAVESRRFIDVPSGYWAEDEIGWAAENGYMTGTGADTFSPENAVTRQQLWMILARLSGLQPADMAEARAWATQSGVSDGTYPVSAVTRQQLVTILYRWAKLMGYDVSGAADLTVFPDYASVADYAQAAMRWSVANKIVAGTAQGTLNPTGTATRAQFAVILYRFCQYIAG